MAIHVQIYDKNRIYTIMLLFTIGRLLFTGYHDYTMNVWDTLKVCKMTMTEQFVLHTIKVKILLTLTGIPQGLWKKVKM